MHSNSFSGKSLILCNMRNSMLFCKGAIPDSLCLVSALNSLFLTNGGNSGLTCSPACLSSITSGNVDAPSTVCVYPQDNGLCGLIAATNIHAKTGYSQWSCTTAGYTSSAPCLSPVWPGVSCVGINVVSISIINFALAGKQCLVSSLDL